MSIEQNVSRLSPDEVMRLNPQMAACVSFLIDVCKKTAEGREALAMWDKYRGVAANEMEADCQSPSVALRAARDALRAAEEMCCSCSGFVVQVEGCCCERSKRRREAEARLKQIIDRI